MREVVVVDAVRTPFGKRNGALSSLHSVDLLASVLTDLVSRTGIEPDAIEQVIGGCVAQVGMQAMNVTRGAWLTAGLSVSSAATTVDAQCGSSQQALTLAHALVAAGLVDVAVACGVESMSRVPMGSTVPKESGLGKPVTRAYWAQHEYTSQFEAAERVADAWSITRADCDELALSSHLRARTAIAAGRFATQLVPLTVPGAEGSGETVRFTSDEGPRETSLEILSTLKPTGRPDGVHTAGTSSQISDGASATLLMSADAARAHGMTPRATIVDSCLIGSDPTMMLTGPIAATRLLLDRNRMAIDDVDVVEINEAFAAVVLAWERELKADMSKVNPNGGAISLGHPLGATGAALIAKAVHELERGDSELALVTMCCGGGLGTGTLLRRVG